MLRLSDPRPCVVPSCSGEMRFGRWSDQDEAAASSPDRESTHDPDGWVCSASTQHFRFDAPWERSSGSGTDAAPSCRPTEDRRRSSRPLAF
jgi:hypothetical protein